MENVVENVIETGTRALRTDRNGGEGAKARSSEWSNLVTDVEDLIKKVANVDDVEIAEIRAKVENTLARAKTTAGQGIAAVRGPRRRGDGGDRRLCARESMGRHRRRRRGRHRHWFYRRLAPLNLPARGVVRCLPFWRDMVPAMLRHLQAYADIAGEDVREAASPIVRRLLVLLVAGAAAFVAFSMGCVWLLALTWDGPWRSWTAGGLALGFAAIAAALCLYRARPRGKRRIEFFSRTRFELSRDRELVERAFNSNEPRKTNGGDHATSDFAKEAAKQVLTLAERRIAESRAEIEALLTLTPMPSRGARRCVT